MSAHRNPHAEAILAAYLAGEPVWSICARFGCGKNFPSSLAERGIGERPAGHAVRHVRPKVIPQVAPSERVANRAAVSEAHRAPSRITLPSLSFLRSPST